MAEEDRLYAVSLVWSRYSPYVALHRRRSCGEGRDKEGD
jgi:hypothetical protein